MNATPKPTTRGLTSRALLKQSNRYVVQHIVQDQIKVIDSKISLAHQAGFDHIEYELPVNFSFNNMDKSDAQTLIYSELLEAYTTSEAAGGKGFPDTYIEGSVAKTLFHVYWLNGMDESERERRQKIIRDHMQKPRSRK
mgnify:CR=1 FL=1